MTANSRHKSVTARTDMTSKSNTNAQMNRKMARMLSTARLAMPPDSPLRQLHVRLYRLAVTHGFVVPVVEVKHYKSHRQSFPDDVGYEAFASHVRLDFDGTRNSLWRCLWFARRLGEKVATLSPRRKYLMIVSFSRGDCTVRYHRFNGKTRWLVGNLDGYKSEAILTYEFGRRRARHL